MKRLTPAQQLRIAFAVILREKIALSACCLILVLPAPGLLAQNNPGFCDELIQLAERALKARDYISASAFVEAALPICPARNDTLRTLTKRINEAINAEKKAAEEGADASHNIARALDLDRSNPALALRLYEYNYYAHVGNIGATLPFIDAVASLPRYYPSALEGHSDWVSSVAWSPDGRFLVSASADSTVKVWDWVEKRVIDSLSHAGPVWRVAWSPAGEQIACAMNNGNVVIWDRKQQVTHPLSGHSSRVNAVAWSPTGEFIASASADSTIKIWNSITRRVLHTFTDHKDVANAVSWSPDGKLLASASSDRTLKVWDWASKPELPEATLMHDAKVSSVAWFPDTANAYIASASLDGMVKVWDWTNRAELHTFQGHFDQVRSVAWSPDKKKLASASSDGSVKVWDWDKKEILVDLNGGSHPSSDQPVRFFSVAWSPDGKQLAGASTDKSIKIWDWTAQQVKSIHAGYKGAVNAVAWSPDGRLLAGAAADSTVRVWDWEKREARHVLNVRSSVGSVTWSPDGKLLAGASEDGKVMIWDWAEQKTIHTLNASSGINSLAWSPTNAHCLATALDNGYIEIWDWAAQQVLNLIEGHWDPINTLAWSPDGKLLASASSDGAVKIWKGTEGVLLHTLSGRWAEIRSVAWSPCGRWVVSASSDHTLKIWDWAAQRVLSTIEEPFDGFWSVAWSPSGGQVASTSHDNTIKVWDVAAKQALFSFAGHSGSINAVAWSPDGKYIAGASRDNTIKVWAARPYLADKIPVYSPVDLLRLGARLQQADLDALNTAEDWALAAEQFKEAGRDERALEFFKKAFARKDSLNWLFDICTLSDSLGEPFEHSRFDAYTDVDAQHQIALFYELRGEKGRAFLFFEKANEQQQQLDRLFRVFSLSKELGKPFEHSRFDNFEEAGDNIDIARFYEQRGEKMRALSFYEKAYKQQQRLDWLYRIFSLALEVGQDFNHDRFNAFESARELYNIAHFYEQRRDFSRAMPFYQKAWAKGPSADIAKKISILSDQLGLNFNPEDLPHEDAAAVAALAGYFEGEEDWGKARAYTQKAYDKSPNDMQKAKLIEMATLSGELTALTRENDLKVLTTVARGLNQKGKWAQAEMVYQKLFDIDAGNPAYRQNLFYVQFRQGKDNFDKFFSNESINNIRIHYDWFNQLANPSSMGGDTLALISWYGKTTSLGERVLQQKPGNKILEASLAQNYNGIGWHGLFKGLFKEAEQALIRGIDLDPANKYLYTNLPIALLFQGRYNEAFDEFDKWKDKRYAPERGFPAYRDIYLEDFLRLERSNAIPPERREDVERIRRYLRDGVRE